MVKSKKNKTVTIRVTRKQKQKMEKIGEGNHRHGIVKLLNIYDMLNKDPTIILQKELSHFGNLIKAFASDNHYEHYVDSNMPTVLLKFIKTGRIDNSIINSRMEKPIDSFNGDKKNEEKKQ